MRQTIRRRLEALEQEERSREQQERSSLQSAVVDIWTIVLAYSVGGLKSGEEEDVGEAYARALNYPSDDDLSEAISGAVRHLQYPSEDDYSEAELNAAAEFSKRIERLFVGYLQT